MTKHKATRPHRRRIARTGILILAVLSVLGSVVAIIAATSGQSQAAAARDVVPASHPQASHPEVVRPAVVHPARVRPAARPVRTPSASRSAERTEVTRSIRIAAVAGPRTMQRMLDRCIGAIQINWSGHAPEIARHNYCGGSWYAGVRTGELITVHGGSLWGTYRVGAHRTVGKGASTRVLDGLGDVVLQTCVGHHLELVGLHRV